MSKLVRNVPSEIVKLLLEGVGVLSGSGRNWTRLAGSPADGLFLAVRTDGTAGVSFAASATEGLYEVRWGQVAEASRDSVRQRRD